MHGRAAEPRRHSPLSTAGTLLTPCGIVIGGCVHHFGAKNRLARRAEHPIWYCLATNVPYLAVNKVEQLASQRFGRDSFQTRSTP
jgi:hypothetical protein